MPSAAAVKSPRAERRETPRPFARSRPFPYYRACSQASREAKVLSKKYDKNEIQQRLPKLRIQQISYSTLACWIRSDDVIITKSTQRILLVIFHLVSNEHLVE